MRVFASCDSVYFLAHHKAFYNSVVKVGGTPIIEVVNPTEEVKAVADKLENIHFVEVENTSPAFFCSNRFFSAEKYLTEEGMFITDIDCVFNAKIPGPKQDVGLFFRPENPDTMKIAAGLVWYSGSEASRKFAKTAAEKIKSMPDRWFVDQLGLLIAWLECKNEVSFFPFNSLHMDWEFTPGTYMWTGKGDRKNSNKTYLDRKKENENA